MEETTKKLIKKAMVDRGCTVTQLAARVGCSRGWLSANLNGHEASPKVLRKAFRLLRLPVSLALKGRG